MVTIEGNPWFVASDVFPALGFSLAGGTTPYLRNLDAAEKMRVTRADSQDLFMGVRAPSYTLISESGLYKLILRSDKAEAKPFQDWVTKVVLPAIRKDGGYIMGEEKVVSG